MPTPKSGYYIDDVRIPSVTQILSKLKDPNPLMSWVHKLTLAGLDYKKESRHAANIGSYVHACIENSLSDGPNPNASEYDLDGDDQESCTNAITAFQSWQQSKQCIEVLEQEVSLISKQYRFGGTFDLLANINGKLTVVDWKTSARLYPENEIQAAAYCILCAEAGYAIQQYTIVRLCKESAIYVEVTEDIGSERYSLAHDAFLNAIGLYTCLQKIQKR